MPFVPKQFKPYFWDVETAKLTKDNKSQILDRLLEYGDDRAYAWCRGQFSLDDIIERVKKSRSLSRKSANFWAFIFNIPRNQVLCLNRSYQKKHRKLWKY